MPDVYLKTIEIYGQGDWNTLADNLINRANEGLKFWGEEKNKFVLKNTPDIMPFDKIYNLLLEEAQHIKSGENNIKLTVQVDWDFFTIFKGDRNKIRGRAYYPDQYGISPPLKTRAEDGLSDFLRYISQFNFDVSLINEKDMPNANLICSDNGELTIEHVVTKQS